MPDRAVESGVATGIVMLVAAAGMSILQAMAAAAGAAPGAATPPPIPGGRAPDPILDPDGHPLTVHDGSHSDGKPGQYWVHGRWVDRAEARQAMDELNAERAARQRERDAFQRETEHQSEERRARNEAEAKQHARAREVEQRAREEAEAARERRADRVTEAMQKRAQSEGGDLQANVDELIRRGDHAGLEDLYRDALNRDLEEGLQIFA